MRKRWLVAGWACLCLPRGASRGVRHAASRRYTAIMPATFEERTTKNRIESKGNRFVSLLARKKEGPILSFLPNSFQVPYVLICKREAPLHACFE